MPEEERHEELPTDLPVDQPTDDPVSNAPLTEEDDEYVYDESEYDKGFVDRVDTLMGDLNLNRKHFSIFAGCILLLIIGIVISFVLLFRFFGNEPEDVVAPETRVVEETKEKKGFLGGIFKREGKDSDSNQDDDVEVIVPDESEDIETQPEETETPDSETTSITPSVELGRGEVVDYDTVSISATIFYASTDISEDRLAYYVRTYRKVRNIFNTDLFNFLNSVEDRQGGYDAFLAQFKGANEQAKLAYEEVRQDIEVYEQRLAALTEEKLVVENRFFEAMDNLESESLPEILEAFQDLTTKESIVKSELAARKAIAQKYELALPVIEKKIEAVEVNRDPFVKGVRVVEFQQVDLDLIIEGQ